MILYWKKGLYFGKTTEDGIKKLQSFDCKVKCISGFHFYLLSFIKYLCTVVFIPVILTGLLIMTFCRLIIEILDKPINIYIKYFFK